MKWLINKKWVMFAYGMTTAFIGLGFQNYNPFEPRACTHSCTIFLGIVPLLIIILINYILNVIQLLKSKDIRKKVK